MQETGRLIPYVTEMFRFQAWMALGKVANPMTGALERDLQVARHFIDLLAELETRTQGNRSADESRLLQGVLTELRINYLDEMKRPAAASSEEAGGTPDASAEEAAAKPNASAEPASEAPASESTETPTPSDAAKEPA